MGGMVDPDELLRIELNLPFRMRLVHRHQLRGGAPFFGRFGQPRCCPERVAGTGDVENGDVWIAKCSLCPMSRLDL